MFTLRNSLCIRGKLLFSSVSAKLCGTRKYRESSSSPDTEVHSFPNGFPKKSSSAAFAFSGEAGLSTSREETVSSLLTAARAAFRLTSSEIHDSLNLTSSVAATSRSF
uniref:Putative secreted protein n=1 Tax=Ixodes ricinus TaxID=34613 RepID=A0A6B0UE57_IXORI